MRGYNSCSIAGFPEYLVFDCFPGFGDKKEIASGQREINPVLPRRHFAYDPLLALGRKVLCTQRFRAVFRFGSSMLVAFRVRRKIIYGR